jgi:sugar/nucleoside kinase (ribokinase family)
MTADREAPALYDVVGLGNALVDVICRAKDQFLDEHGLVKGSMELVDLTSASRLYDSLDGAVEMSGGSAANTMCGVSALGGRAAYIGVVSGDSLGSAFAHDMRAVGVQFKRALAPASVPTGRCVIVVTPDAERTMSTYLGASSLLKPSDIDVRTVAAGSVLYLEGYLFDRVEAKKAFRHAAGIAHRSGRLVALSLSDSFCVNRHRDDFHRLVADDVDVLFGNDAELIALFQARSVEEAISQLRGHCRIAAVTLGARGSIIVNGDAVIEVPAKHVQRVIDTTGAGDMYAAGFLRGLTSGLSLDHCGALGSLVAAEVISHVGPRPITDLGSLVDQVAMS